MGFLHVLRRRVCNDDSSSVFLTRNTVGAHGASGSGKHTAAASGGVRSAAVCTVHWFAAEAHMPPFQKPAVPGERQCQAEPGRVGVERPGGARRLLPVAAALSARLQARGAGWGCVCVGGGRIAEQDLLACGVAAKAVPASAGPPNACQPHGYSPWSCTSALPTQYHMQCMLPRRCHCGGDGNKRLAGCCGTEVDPRVMARSQSSAIRSRQKCVISSTRQRPKHERQASTAAPHACTRAAMPPPSYPLVPGHECQAHKRCYEGMQCHPVSHRHRPTAWPSAPLLRPCRLGMGASHAKYQPLPYPVSAAARHPG